MKPLIKDTIKSLVTEICQCWSKTFFKATIKDCLYAISEAIRQTVPPLWVSLDEGSPYLNPHKSCPYCHTPFPENIF